MKNKNLFETITGIFIVIGVVCFLFLTFEVSGLNLNNINQKTYIVTAKFKDIGSLRENASVKIAGVEVGRVTDIKLSKSYNGFIADVVMTLDTGPKIPASYSATISMAGILGDNYISLSPSKHNILNIIDNNKNKYLHNGSVISLENTESALNLNSLINTFVASKDS